MSLRNLVLLSSAAVPLLLSGLPTTSAAAVTFYWPHDEYVVSAPGDILGGEPLSVDAGGSTHYAASLRAEPFTYTDPANSQVITLYTETTTEYMTFRADASRVQQVQKTVADDGAEIIVTNDCALLADGAGIVCEEAVEVGPRPATTYIDARTTVTLPSEPATTFTATRSGGLDPWLTISNVETWDIPGATGAPRASGDGEGNGEDEEDTGAARVGRDSRAGVAMGAMVLTGILAFLC